MEGEYVISETWNRWEYYEANVSLISKETRYSVISFPTDLWIYSLVSNKCKKARKKLKHMKFLQISWANYRSVAGWALRTQHKAVCPIVSVL